MFGMMNRRNNIVFDSVLRRTFSAGRKQQQQQQQQHGYLLSSISRKWNKAFYHGSISSNSASFITFGTFLSAGILFLSAAATAIPSSTTTIGPGSAPSPPTIASSRNSNNDKKKESILVCKNNFSFYTTIVSNFMKNSILLPLSNNNNLFSFLAPTASAVVDCEGVVAGAAAGTNDADNNTRDNDKDDDVFNSWERVPLPPRATPSDESGHAIFGALLTPNRIERYEIYKNKAICDDIINNNKSTATTTTNHQEEDVLCGILKFGTHVNGHPGIVHGGILALFIDEIVGWSYEAIGVPMAVTANLSLDYRKPITENTKVYVHVQLVRRENRKLFFRAQITNSPTTGSNKNDGVVVYTEATSLYITPREKPTKIK